MAAAAAVPFVPQRVLFGGQAVSDGFSGFVAVVVCAGLVLSALLGRGWLAVRNMERGEYYALALFGASGMVLLGMATDLLLAFIAIEVMSLAVYSLAAYPRRGQRAPEAAFKYFILGSFASAILLYGSALFYGATGSTLLSSMRGGGGALLAAGLSLVLVGLAFKVAAVPFHAWTPDVYEGAPTPVTAFMAAGVKAAAFAFLTRGVLAMVAGTPYAVGSELGGVLGFLAVLTMVVGNLFALPQRNVKRMLAYSSIAHAGYLLVGVVAATTPGRRGPRGSRRCSSTWPPTPSPSSAPSRCWRCWSGGIRTPTSRAGGAWDISRFAGLASRRPWLAFAMAIFMLSLAGVPPTAGFVAKLSVFQSAAAANAWGLAVVGVLTSILGVYYYLRVVVAMYMRPAEVEEPSAAPATVVVAIAVAALVVVVVGFSPEPLAAWARAAVFGHVGATSAVRSPLTSSGASRHVDAQPLHLAPQRGGGDAELAGHPLPGRRRSAPARPRWRAARRPRPRRRASSPRRSGRAVLAEGHVGRPDLRPVGEGGRLLHHVLQLADVARPVVLEHPGERVHRPALLRAAPPVVPLEEVPGQERDVLAPLAQRRDAQGNHVEPVEEVLAEALLGDGAAQVLVGGGDDADVDLHRRRTRPPGGSPPPGGRAGAWPGSPAWSRRSRR